MMKWYNNIFISLLVISLLAGVGCDKDNAPQQDTSTAQQAVETNEVGTNNEEEANTTAEDNTDEETAPTKAVVGQLAPDFELQDETGKTHTLSQYKGKTVILEWFNIPCPYVRRHYASNTFDKTIETAGGLENIVWLAIDTTHDNTPEDTKEWKEKTERKFDYPVLQDPTGIVGRMYDAKTTPHMYIIDAKGVLRYAGAIDDDPRGRVDEPTNYVIAALKALNAGKIVDPSTTTPYGCTVKYN